MRDVGLKRGRLYGADASAAAGCCSHHQTGRRRWRAGAERVDHVADVSGELDVPAALLRPDGHVAWMGEDQQDLLSQLPR